MYTHTHTPARGKNPHGQYLGLAGNRLWEAVRPTFGIKPCFVAVRSQQRSMGVGQGSVNLKSSYVGQFKDSPLFLKGLGDTTVSPGVSSPP